MKRHAGLKRRAVAEPDLAAILAPVGREAGAHRVAAVATPVNWQPGDNVIIPPSVPDEEARKKYPGGWKALKPYLRIIPQPQ